MCKDLILSPVQTLISDLKDAGYEVEGPFLGHIFDQTLPVIPDVEWDILIKDTGGRDTRRDPEDGPSYEVGFYLLYGYVWVIKDLCRIALVIRWNDAKQQPYIECMVGYSKAWSGRRPDYSLNIKLRSVLSQEVENDARKRFGDVSGGEK